jgi:sulfite reductase (ferredoxin)
LDDVHPALVDLFSAGLSTKGGGGNTVRNITGCCDAGVCTRELFDVSPHVVALTEFMLPDPLSYQLPRKYKIAFSGCSKDCAGATINDLGLIARVRDGSRGFAIYVAGGMGSSARVGDLLEAFVSEDEIHLVAEAVKRVFDKHGNRRNRNKARLRFLIQEIGLPRFRELFEMELAALRRCGPRSDRISRSAGSPSRICPRCTRNFGGLD